METLSVGMYVRTLNGIVKIYKIQDNVIEDTKGHLHYGDFVKASYNITDILEIGDYVNGHEVKDIDYAFDDIALNVKKPRIVPYIDNIKNAYIDNIKSVITHEQMEQIAYKVGE